MLKCGMCEIDITPQLGCDIPGYLEVRKASGFKDRLYAKAVVFDNGTSVNALVALDILGILSCDVAAIRERAEKATGISGANIMVSATHTHTGAPIAELYGNSRDDEYVSFMVKKAADAVTIAYNTRKPAVIGFGRGSESGVSFNRRYYMKDGTVMTNPGIKNPMVDRPAGPIDPEVAVMRIDTADGCPIGIITNFACHLDVVGGTEFCADYPGELSRKLKKAFGENFVSIFLTGACGNINHVDINASDFREPGLYLKMGRILAGEVIKVREKIKTSGSIEIGAGSRTFTGKLRKVTEEDIRSAEAVLDSSGSQFVDRFFADQLLKAAKLNPETSEMEVQVLKVGDLSITGLPGEIFVEFGLDIKKASPFAYNMVSTLTNGLNGYIAIREAFNQGGYETKLTTYTYMEPETGYRMVENALDIMKDIK